MLSTYIILIFYAILLSLTSKLRPLTEREKRVQLGNLRILWLYFISSFIYVLTFTRLLVPEVYNGWCKNLQKPGLKRNVRQMNKSLDKYVYTGSISRLYD